jgi:hypothetical protein
VAAGLHGVIRLSTSLKTDPPWQRNASLDDDVENLMKVLEFLDEQVALIGEQLPSPLSGVFAAREQGGRKFYPEELYRAVSRSLDLPLCLAMEHAQVVCQVFAEALNTQGRELLDEALPRDWRELFEPRPTYVPPPKPDHSDKRTLATGTPGSATPLSEAALAHRNSLAATEHPHEGDKLSTSRGKPHKRTLAEGKPGSSRPISESD